MKKGQAIFEFLIAAVVFFAIVFYLIGFLGGAVGTYSSGYLTSTLTGEAIQVSEYIGKNRGLWIGGEPVVVGIAKNWPIWDLQKIESLNLYCQANYGGLLKKLDLTQKPFSQLLGNETISYRLRLIIINETDTLLECGPVLSELESGSVKRFGVSENGEVLELRVFVA